METEGISSGKFVIFILIGLVSAILVTFIYVAKIDFINTIDLKLRDTRFRLRGPIEPPEKVVIVAIDSKSIDELGRWPWDRRTIAQLIKTLSPAKVIALDMVFSEPSLPESDTILSKTINKAKNVVVGYYFREEETSISPLSLSNLRNSRVKIIKTFGNITGLPVREFPYAELNIPSIKGEAGFFNLIPDDDGVFRNINLLFLYDGELYPSLSLQAMKEFKDRPIRVEIEEYGIKGIGIGDKWIPCDESGRLTINYYGKGGTIRTIQAVDLIKKRVPEREIRDAIVLVGATETGISDIRNTPFDPVMPGVEIHATVVSNMLKGHYLLSNAWVTVLDILFITIPVVILALILRKVLRTVVSLLFLVIVLGVTYTLNLFIFKTYFLNLAMIYPFISILLFYISSEAYRNLIVEKKSRFLKKAFSSYVSSELVNIIIKNPEVLKLGGEKREITVLFSDIRDFTTISEVLQPEKLVSLLNHYLAPMTEIVLKHRGMLDKYIGDAIMAIYNAPVNLPDHPEKAVLTALEMIRELKRLNEDFKKKGFPEIQIGIGIHTGVAITGNMGTNRRFDYTAIGDTVNLASRLEGLNKLYGTNIIISYSTFQNLSTEVRALVRKLDLIRVKGKKEPVKVYELIEENSPLIELIKDFEKALSLYRQRRFKEAEEIFKHLSNTFYDKPSEIFAQRCRDFCLTPPPDDWDGVYVARQK